MTHNPVMSPAVWQGPSPWQRSLKSRACWSAARACLSVCDAQREPPDARGAAGGGGTCTRAHTCTGRLAPHLKTSDSGSVRRASLELLLIMVCPGRRKADTRTHTHTSSFFCLSGVSLYITWLLTLTSQHLSQARNRPLMLGNDQNGPIAQTCPRFASRTSTLVLIM